MLSINAQLRCLRAGLFALLVLALPACSLFGGKDAPVDQEAVAQEEDVSAEQQDGLPPVDLPPNPYFEDIPSVGDATRRRFEQGVAAMQGKEWSGAESIFQTLHENHPKLSGPLVNLGIIARQKGDLVQARQHFLQAIEVNRANQEAYNQLALLYREQGKFKQAEETFQQAIDIWPGYASIHLNLGILYELYMGEMESALAQFEYYQRLQSEPDKKIAGWIIDLQRRIKVASR